MDDFTPGTRVSITWPGSEPGHIMFDGRVGTVVEDDANYPAAARGFDVWVLLDDAYDSPGTPDWDEYGFTLDQLTIIND